MWRTTYCPSYNMVPEWRPVCPWPRCYRLEAVKNHMRDSSRKGHCNPVRSGQYWDFGRQWPIIRYNEHRKPLGNEERGIGKEISQNGQGSQRLRDVAGRPKPTCYPDGISCSKYAEDCHEIHRRHRRDRQSIVLTLSTLRCSCICIVRKISLATTFVGKGPPGRTNSNIECLLGLKHQLSSSRKWWGQPTWKHFGHRTLA